MRGTGTVLLVAALAVLTGCVALVTKIEETGPVLLSADYRDGGPSPIGFLLTVHDNGLVTYHSPRWKTYQRQLAPADLELVRAASSNLLPLSEQMTQLFKYRFACCDAQEVGLLLANGETLGIPVDMGPLPEGAVALVQLINRLGRTYFGHRYSLPIPTPAARRAA